MKAIVSRCFQPGEGPSRSLLRDCETDGSSAALVLGRPSENLSAQSEQKKAGGGRSERWVSGMEWSRHILVASHGSGAAHRVLLQIRAVNESLLNFTEPGSSL